MVNLLIETEPNSALQIKTIQTFHPTFGLLNLFIDQNRSKSSVSELLNAPPIQELENVSAFI